MASTYTKSGFFGWAGGGKNGAIVDLWAASRFTATPEENQAPPSGSPDAGPVVTGTEFGGPGAFVISGITSVQDYYVRVQYGGNTYWGFCPEGTLGGQTGGGGGGGGSANSPIVTAYPITYNTPNISTTAYVVYTPVNGDVITDLWIEIDTAWNGLTPQFDWLAFGGTVGMLATYGAAPFKMNVADSNNHGLLGGTPNSWSAALATVGYTNALPVTKSQVKIDAAGPILVAVTQDGTFGTATTASVSGTSPPSSPLHVVTGTNDTFIWQGVDPVLGGGGALAEIFTMAAGTYTGAAGIATAMAAALGTSSEAFSTKATVSVSGSVLKVSGLVVGGANNGDQLLPGPTDVSASLGFANPSILSGGASGNPGATQGSAILYVESVTPL